MDETRFRQQLEERNKKSKKNERKHGECEQEEEEKEEYHLLTKYCPDDPYYCGLRARIPNFAKSKAQKEKESKYAGIGAMRDIGGVGGHHLVWGGPQRGYLDNGESNTISRDTITITLTSLTVTMIIHITSHHLALLSQLSPHSHSSFPVPKGINMTAPPNHPDPIYAGFSRPFERNPTTRVPTQHHRGGKSGHSTELAPHHYSHRYFTF